MYHEFFGLKEPAFSIAVNPRYLFMSDQHREALAHLLYGIQNGGFVMLTGEVGTGKTTIIRCLLEQLPSNTDIAIILNPMASAPELLSTICDELGAGYIADDLTVKVLTDALNEFLLNNHRKGRKTVVLIDEAQLLKVPVLEQIRLLTNLETTTEKLLQIMLVGQPELKRLLARPALRQLSQRITARFHLDALTLAETTAYIQHRLKVAGLPDHLTPFNDAIIKKIHEFSGGIPRLINVICERLLLGAYAQNQHYVDKKIFAAALKEVAGTAPPRRETTESVSGRMPWHILFASVIATLMFALWFLLPDESETSTGLANSPAPDNAKLVASGNVIDARRFMSSVSVSSEASVNNAVAAQASLSGIATRDQVAVQLALFKFAGLNALDKKNPCVSLNKSTYECSKAKLNSWDELKDLNRPGVMTLATEDKKWVYAMLIGLSENHALFLSNGAEVVVPWSDLVERWNGDYLYVWSRPTGFEGMLQLGDRSDLVTWVAEQFAKLDQQPAPLTRQFFTDRLQKRIELFQSNNGIIPDGIFNEQTLRRLNEALGIDKPLAELDEQKIQQHLSGKGQ